MIAPDIALEHIRMHHTPQYLFMKAPAGQVTLLPGADTEGSEYRPPVLHFRPTRAGRETRNAPVHVLVPLCNARWNPLIELGNRVSLRSRVHGPDQNEVPLAVPSI